MAAGEAANATSLSGRGCAVRTPLSIVTAAVSEERLRRKRRWLRSGQRQSKPPFGPGRSEAAVDASSDTPHGDAFRGPRPPAGYPDRITSSAREGAQVGAYSEERYDDVDIEWTAGLLSGEVRLDCEEGYQWLRSGRRIHIFGEVADEPGIISVGSVGLLSPSTIVCRSEEAAAVHAAAQACGSPALVSYDRWSGIPDGWMILSGYRPAHAAACGLATGLTVLDPGVGSEISAFGRPAYPLSVVCGGRPAENRDRAVPRGGDRYDRWTSGRAGRGWRLDRRWVGEARRSSYRCSARTLGGLPDHRGPLDEGRLGGLGRAPGALRRFGACALGRRPGLRRRRVGPWRRICRGGRCDAVRCLPWASARRRRAPGTARCAGRGGSARRAPSIPHLCMGAAAEAGPYCMAQSTTGCVRHARDRSAMGRRGAKRLREKASARWWRCAG